MLRILPSRRAKYRPAAFQCSPASGCTAVAERVTPAIASEEADASVEVGIGSEGAR